MSTNRPPATSTSSTTTPPSTERSYFEQQREILLKEIGASFEHVKANMNKLNRSLEAVITVGTEFAGVEALWSQFENVMGDTHSTAEKEGDVHTSTEGDTQVTEEEGEGDSTQMSGVDDKGRRR